MKTYQTPNVYVEEIPSFPPSVVSGATAVPAFIGYTEKAGQEKEGKYQYNFEPVRITSMIEYENIFGKAYFPKKLFTIDTSKPKGSRITVKSEELKFLLYYQLQMYFANGGGVCYIVSVGQYTSDTTNSPTKKNITDGLDALKKVDEPTLIILTDAVTLGDDYYKICQDALKQCNDLIDRFVILDVPASGEANIQEQSKDFRTGIGQNNLKYGAAYYPYLSTNLSYFYEDQQITFENKSPKNNNTQSVLKKDEVNVSDVAAETPPSNTESVNLKIIKENKSQLYSEIKEELGKLRVTLPPSGAIAGVYASVDRDRGVWKAPANVSINAVIEPTIKITDDDQKDLNVDLNGKSINVIRSFTGKGTLVWGSRTLAGNDNEWRYIPVRRLFNLIEKSIKRSISFAVFEPNNEMTWLKVRVMIENYLNELWSQGALAGNKAEDAYFVNIGLGKTMTQQDILEGKMITKIGIAAVRPAEFIIIQFSHLLQKS